MKLAMITTYATPRNMRRELLEAAIARGHEVVVLSPDAAEPMAPAVAAIGGRFRPWAVGRTAIAPRQDLASALRLVSLLRQERPDVVLVYQIKAMLIAPVAARLARVPRVVGLVNGLGGVFDLDGFGATRKAQVARAVYGMSLRAVDEAVFQNADDPELLRSLGLLGRTRWRTVPGTGVDVTALAAQPPFAGPPTFTLVSRLLASKGIRELMTAARAIRARHPQARFRLVGQLEAEDHPDAIRRTELDGWIAEGLVEYLGFTNDIAGVLRDTTVFVLPSYYREGVPRTNLEALAVGRPIVTTDWVGCRDTVIAGETGLLVPPRDAAALTAALERYLTEPALIARHGAAGRKLAEARFDVRRVNALMLDALGLAGRSAP